MSQMEFKKYLINEISRSQVVITADIYNEMLAYVESDAGKEAYKIFCETKLPSYLKTSKPHGFRSDMRKLSDAIPGLLKVEPTRSVDDANKTTMSEEVVHDRNQARS